MSVIADLINAKIGRVVHITLILFSMILPPYGFAYIFARHHFNSLDTISLLLLCLAFGACSAMFSFMVFMFNIIKFKEIFIPIEKKVESTLPVFAMASAFNFIVFFAPSISPFLISEQQLALRDAIRAAMIFWITIWAGITILNLISWLIGKRKR